MWLRQARTQKSCAVKTSSTLRTGPNGSKQNGCNSTNTAVRTCLVNRVLHHRIMVYSTLSGLTTIKRMVLTVRKRVAHATDYRAQAKPTQLTIHMHHVWTITQHACSTPTQRSTTTSLLVLTLVTHLERLLVQNNNTTLGRTRHFITGGAIVLATHPSPQAMLFLSSATCKVTQRLHDCGPHTSTGSSDMISACDQRRMIPVYTQEHRIDINEMLNYGGKQQ